MSVDNHYSAFLCCLRRSPNGRNTLLCDKKTFNWSSIFHLASILSSNNSEYIRSIGLADGVMKCLVCVCL